MSTFIFALCSPQLTSTVQLHTSLDQDCRPEKMTRGRDGAFRVRRMVPWGHRVEYFFSVVPGSTTSNTPSRTHGGSAGTDTDTETSTPVMENPPRAPTSSLAQRTASGNSILSQGGDRSSSSSYFLLSALDQMQICCSQQLRATAKVANFKVRQPCPHAGRVSRLAFCFPRPPNLDVLFSAFLSSKCRFHTLSMRCWRSVGSNRRGSAANSLCVSHGLDPLELRKKKLRRPPSRHRPHGLPYSQLFFVSEEPGFVFTPVPCAVE